MHPDRQPPYAPEAEVSVLGAMLIDGDAVARAAEMLADQHFYREANRRVFRAMLALFQRGVVIDPTTLGECLTDSRELEMVGGMSYIAELIDAVPTAANIEYHAAIVRDRWQRRRVIEACSDGIRAAYEPDGRTNEEIADLVGQRITEAVGGSGRGMEWVKKILYPTFQKIEELQAAKGGITGLSTGLKAVDNLTGGLQKGDLIIVAARPSMGKAQPLDAQVLTPHGFVPMWSIRTGSRVIGGDGKAHTVTGVFPQGEKEVYRVTFSDGASAECCDEHLWFTTTVRDRRRGEAGSVKSLREIHESLLYGSDRRPNHWVPWVKPVEFDSPALPLDPYWLGLYLGDGDSGTVVRLNNPEPDIQQAFADGVDNADDVSVHGMTVAVRRSVQVSRRASSTKLLLQAMGLSGLRAEEKFIPRQYLHASIEERTALLRGLCDTDGYVYPTGVGVEYSTVSKRLAEDVRFLVLSLGGRVTTHEKVPTYTYRGERRTGQLAYRLNICFEKGGIVPVSSEKHLALWKPRVRNSNRCIVSIEKVGVKPCQCIRIDSADHLYVTDDFIVTHNTAFVTGIALHAAIECQVPVAIFSYEMSKRQVVQRMLCSEGLVNLGALLRGQLRDDDFGRLAQAAGHLNTAPLYIEDGGQPTVMAVRSAARRLKAEQPELGLIIVDYLQLMEGGGDAENRNQEVSRITRGLKMLAKELDLPVVALSQLSRKVEERSNKRPMLSDLRESGSIEQDADLVGFLYRPEYYMTREELSRSGSEGTAEFIIAKQRNGPTDTAELYFRKECARFEDTSNWGVRPAP